MKFYMCLKFSVTLRESKNRMREKIAVKWEEEIKSEGNSFICFDTAEIIE